MPQQNLALAVQSSLPPALAAGGALVTFIAAEYRCERRKRRELRHALERHRSRHLGAPLAGAPAPASSGGDRASTSSRSNSGNQAGESFPAFGSFFLHHLSRYGLALLFVGLALYVRWLLEPSLHGRLPYGFFLLAVVATALVAGIWETLLALTVGFLVAAWYFVDPPGFQIGGVFGWWGALLYAVTGCGIVWFMQSEHTAWLRTLERDIAYFDRLKELDRERADRKQQADREMLASIVDTAQNAILSVTPEGRIATWNAAAESLLRFSAREAIGQPLALIVPPEHRAEQQRLLQQISRGEPTEEWQTFLCGKDGGSVAVSLTISPLNERSGNLIGASLIARNGSPKQ